MKNYMENKLKQKQNISSCPSEILKTCHAYIQIQFLIMCFHNFRGEGEFIIKITGKNTNNVFLKRIQVY